MSEQKNTISTDGPEDPSVKEALEKFDRESLVRDRLPRAVVQFVMAVSVLLALFHLYTSFSGPLVDVAQRSIHLYTLLGLAFKPGTDDIRESPALYIAGDLLERGARVRAFDPAAIENARNAYPDRLEFGRDAYDVIERADAIVLTTQWAEFRDLDWPRVSRLMRGSVVLDGRNIWNPSVVRAAGLSYIGVGR